MFQIIYNTLKTFTVIYNYLNSFTAIYHHLHSLSVIYNHLLVKKSKYYFPEFHHTPGKNKTDLINCKLHSNHNYLQLVIDTWHTVNNNSNISGFYLCSGIKSIDITIVHAIEFLRLAVSTRLNTIIFLYRTDNIVVDIL